MVTQATKIPATLQVMRYDARRGTFKVIVGDPANVPREILAQRAAEAMRARSFICHTTDDQDSALLGADEICFIPTATAARLSAFTPTAGDATTATTGAASSRSSTTSLPRWRRGTLSFSDDEELATVTARAARSSPARSTARPRLAQARAAVARVLNDLDVDGDARRRASSCASRRPRQTWSCTAAARAPCAALVDDRLRAIVADRGPGLNFLNWTEEAGAPVSPPWATATRSFLITLNACICTPAPRHYLVLDRTI